MTTFAELYAQARKHHQANELPQAEKLYHQLLRADGDNAQVWMYLGMVHQGQGKLADAIDSLKQSLSLKPNYAEAHTQLGLILADQGRFADAAASYQQALRVHRDDAGTWFYLGNAQSALGKFGPAISSFQQVIGLKPDHADAYTSLGIALARQGSVEEAVANLQLALRLRPDHAKAHNNLGVALAELGRSEEAQASWREAIRLKPDYAEAHFNLGVSLAEQRKLAEAIAAYQQALQVKPDYADALNNLGLALNEQGQFVQAVAVLQQAVRLRSDYAEAHNNLALSLVELGRYDESLASFHEALRLRPTYAEAHNNLGTALAAMARTNDALAVYQVALWIRPDYAEVHWNRSLAWLQTGNYELGWPEYEWRWKRKRARPRPFTQPLWDGSELAGKTILVYAEQGMGDTIHFIRYAPLVKQRGGKVVLECPPEMISLLATGPGIDQVVAENTPLPEFDVRVPLMSLPSILHTTLATVPAEVPYLFPPAEHVERWRNEIGATTDFKIGITWQGNPKHKWDRQRSFPLTHFASLARLPGITLYSLQKGAALDQLEALKGRFSVTDLGSRFETFLDTAAALRNLDLVITCDSAVAHLAGALGVPVWAALSFLVDWRWMHQREDTPWYPSMRLFRQTQLGSWEPVFDRIVNEVERLLAVRRGAGTIPVAISLGELLDQISRLQVQIERTSDAVQLQTVQAELTRLTKARDQAVRYAPELESLTDRLRKVNQAIMESEDQVRTCERDQDFGPRFVDRARSIYQNNEQRGDLKRRINEQFGPRT